jgi:hypothetical protein
VHPFPAGLLVHREQRQRDVGGPLLRGRLVAGGGPEVGRDGELEDVEHVPGPFADAAAQPGQRGDRGGIAVPAAEEAVLQVAHLRVDEVADGAQCARRRFG